MRYGLFRPGLMNMGCRKLLIYALYSAVSIHVSAGLLANSYFLGGAGRAVEETALDDEAEFLGLFGDRGYYSGTGRRGR